MYSKAIGNLVSQKKKHVGYCGTWILLNWTRWISVHRKLTQDNKIAIWVTLRQHCSYKINTTKYLMKYRNYGKSNTFRTSFFLATALGVVKEYMWRCSTAHEYVLRNWIQSQRKHWRSNHASVVGLAVTALMADNMEEDFGRIIAVIAEDPHL